MYELLIVDDEDLSRNTLATCFPWSNLGFHIAGQAQDGIEALNFLKNNTVHVILCDIRMPQMSGIDVAKELTSWKMPPVIVFLSAYSDFEYAKEAIRYGVRFYVVKPARFEELNEVFLTLKKELDLRYGLPITNFDSNDDEFIKKVKNYIKENYRSASLKEAASRFYLNPSYVSQLFKMKTNMNFSDYLLKVRMEAAAGLLKDPNNKIYNISNSVGYVNPNNFARAFKTYFGKTPKEYREVLLQNGEF